MAKYSVRAICGHEGCKEVALYEADTRKDQANLSTKYGYGKWRCMRHSRMDELLSPENLTRSTEMISRQESYGRFFGHSGFVAGPGFKLFADDFPAGTKLRVTAEIILPDDTIVTDGDS